MTTKAHERVYRNIQSFWIIMIILMNDVLIGAGVARNIDRMSLAAFGILWIVLFTTVAGRTASTGIFASPIGIHVRNVFSNSDFLWSEIDRFEIDTPGGGLFPQICRIYTKEGQMKRAIGITETNAALTRPMEKRPAAKIVAELNEALANSAGASSTGEGTSAALMQPGAESGRDGNG
jgi:hypothetical protein